MAGCSTVRFSYNQGPTLAYWWLDRYADFSSEQTPQVRTALDGWFAWHRATELPGYALALADMQKLALADVTPEQVCTQQQQWQIRAERAYDQAVPAIAPLLLKLAPAQVAHIQKRMATSLKDAERDHLQPDPAERRQASLKRTIERAEDLYGRLDDAQRQWLADELAVSTFDAQAWLAERRARQQDMLAKLREWLAAQPDPAVVQAGLRRFAHEAAHSPRPAHRAYAERLALANCAMAAQLHNRTSTEQRRKAADKLKGWEDDVRALAAGR